MFLVLRSVISSDSNVTEVYVEAEETATYSTSVTPSSTRWVGDVLQYRDSLKRETREMWSFVCLLSDLQRCFSIYVYLVVDQLIFMHFFFKKLPILHKLSGGELFFFYFQTMLYMLIYVLVDLEKFKKWFILKSNLS
jgi:hypothetical protein